jgi:peptidoglycan-associated lipoprotein
MTISAGFPLFLPSEAFLMIRRSSLLVLLPLSLLSAACFPKKAPVTAPDAAAAAAAAKARQDSIAAAAEAAKAAEAARAADAAKAAETARAAEVAKAKVDSTARAEVIARAITATRSTFAEMIFFEYDQADLSAESRATLDAKLPILNANPSMRIRIAGHTDERGSDEYNIALGQRRAAAAKRYLVSQGIAEDRIDVVSFGEERSLVQGSDESAWAQNRRDEFEIIVGGDALRVP